MFNDKKEKKGPPDDVMKTPLLKDSSALCRCNPPTFRLTCVTRIVARHWQEKSAQFSM